MAGHIRKRMGKDGKPSYQALLSWRDAETGKTIQVNGGTHARKKDAEEALVNLATKYRGGRRMANTDRTFAMLADEFLKTVAVNKGESTAYGYATKLHRHFIPRIGDIRVRDLTTKDFDNIWADLLAQGYARSYVVVLRGSTASPVMTQAVKWGWRNDNPVALCQPITVPRKNPAIYTPEQVRDLLEEADAQSPMLGTYLRFVAATGVRNGEACALQFSDIDWETGAVKITKTVQVLTGSKVKQGTKTNRDRTIQVDAATLGKLAEWRDMVSKQMETLGITFDASMYLFSTQPDHRKAIDPRRVDHRFDTIRRRLSMDTMTIRDLRHTVATTALAAGVDVKTASDFLGNSPKTLLDFYAGVTDEARARVSGIMGQFLGGSDAR